MEVGKTFKKIMIDRDIKQTDIADKLGITKQYFNDQLRRNNFRIGDIEKIADILDCDTRLQFIDRDTGKVVDAE